MDRTSADTSVVMIVSGGHRTVLDLDHAASVHLA